jgi:beta-galactosidase
MRMALQGKYSDMTWLGRGPHENYIDRKRSAAMGVYQATVDSQFVPYIFPSENGGKADCEVWTRLADNCLLFFFWFFTAYGFSFLKKAPCT